MFPLLARTRRLSLALALVGALAVVLVAPASADTVTGTATVTGGSLSEVASGTPGFSVTLNGTDQTATSSAMTLDANDPTGTGAGWNLTITSTQFSTGGATPKTLATTATTITGVASACKQGTCTLPTNAITYSALTVPAGATAPTAVKFFNAAANSGMGEFTITPTFSISIPANAYAGTYSSTVTLSIVSAP